MADIHPYFSEFFPCHRNGMFLLGSKAVYHPMKNHSSENFFPDKYDVETLTMGVMSDAKHKRDEDFKDTCLVVLYMGSKKESRDVGASENQRRVMHSDGKVEKL